MITENIVNKYLKQIVKMRKRMLFLYSKLSNYISLVLIN